MRTPDVIEQLTDFEKSVRALSFSGKTPDQIAEALQTNKRHVVRALNSSTRKLRYEIKQGTCFVSYRSLRVERFSARTTCRLFVRSASAIWSGVLPLNERARTAFSKSVSCSITSGVRTTYLPRPRRIEQYEPAQQ